MKKKIIALSVGRSDYDRYFPIINELNKNKKADFFLCVGSNHQKEVFGKTLNYISKKFKILKNNKKSLSDKKKKKINHISKDFLIDLSFLSSKIKEINPDLIIVLGDRYEMIAGPLAAAPYNIPVLHLFGGASTEGAIDELIRHAITKMSHYHLVLIDKYKKRLIKMGEESWRIKTIGMHELKTLKNQKKIKLEDLNKKYKFDFSRPYILFTFHPVTLELRYLKRQLRALFQSIKKTKMNVIFTYPNADPGYDKIINFFKKFKDNKKYLIIKNAGIELYSNFLQNSQLVFVMTKSRLQERYQQQFGFSE